MEQHSANGNINFAISLFTSFLAWITAPELDIYLSILLKLFSLITAILAARSYWLDIKHKKNRQ